MSIDLENLTIKKAGEAFRKKEFSVTDLVETYLHKIKKRNPELNAYLEIYDDVLSQAEMAQKRIDAGEEGELIGIPLAIKDNILIDGKKASSASKILEGYVATYDATVITKLKEAGAIFLGRTNMDEFALGGSTEKSAYGVTKNPYDNTRVSGGTSGGSASAVAANLALVALGSDTGGSIRQPSSFCGVVGLKPTYGMVSRSGLMAAVSSFDCIGPIAKNVKDAEIIFNVIKGNDSLDSTTIKETTYKKLDKKGKIKIGVPWRLINQGGIDNKVKKNFEEAIGKMQSLGFEVVEKDLPTTQYSLALYYILNFAEVSSNLARFDGVKYGLHKSGATGIEDYFNTRGDGFGKEARRRILLGTYVLSAGYYEAYYSKAQSARDVLKKEIDSVFKTVDFIATPTSPIPAWKIGEKSDPLSAYLADIFTVTANITGLPAISLPSGFSEINGKKLPLGFQLMAPHACEKLLFSIGKKFLNEVE